jgi:DNA-binding NarL/FixJ family response regulator
MPRMTGLQAAAEIRRRAPDVRTLILSMHDDEQYFFQALRAGASGYVLKSAADRDLVEACRATMRGEPFVHAGAVAALITDYLERVRNGEEPGDDPLTPREIEVLKLIAESWTNERIAGELVISVKTVERHRANMMEKLGCATGCSSRATRSAAGLVAP